MYSQNVSSTVADRGQVTYHLHVKTDAIPAYASCLEFAPDVEWMV